MGQPSTIYKPGKLNHVWNYLSSTLDNFKAALLGYRTYKAMLYQSGTDAPIATVLENTLKVDFIYEYDSTGFYYMYTNKPLFGSPTETIDGKKVEVFINAQNTISLSRSLYTITAYPVFFDEIDITSFDTPADLFADDVLGNWCSTVLEIRVYNK